MKTYIVKFGLLSFKYSDDGVYVGIPKEYSIKGLKNAQIMYKSRLKEARERTRKKLRYPYLIDPYKIYIEVSISLESKLIVASYFEM